MTERQTAPRNAALPRLRILCSFARPHKGALMRALLLALVASALGLATPMVTKWVLDALGESSPLQGPLACLLVLLVVGVAVRFRQWTLLGAVGERVVLEARESMVRRFLRATVPTITRRPTGELVTRVTSDTVLLREAATDALVGLINGTVMLLGTLVLMGVLDVVLLGTTMASVTVVGVLFAVLMPGIATAQQRAQEHLGQARRSAGGHPARHQDGEGEPRRGPHRRADRGRRALRGRARRPCGPPRGAGLDGLVVRHRAGDHRDSGRRRLAGGGGADGGIQPDRLSAVRVRAHGPDHRAQLECHRATGRHSSRGTHP